ncbi:NTP transferase domain-containing protein [Streptomyces sp. FXJ1.172]|uniref:bifunctional UDP-N-acetylglucosamine diphosphorylase/glucosamine-1-phosphate N-acetyltransferase GlmU n=1 Tax=Streptomyces sp. FXJ1.172 TaxID=710705 RepID=UPI0007CFD63B|nr:NTP transferase domain-containing protein [Streptomyces sp. FXJ1.172]WEO94715.1 NTP transferase domain-containing protein [Streptomyces sp. FXJ1.172]
MISQRKLDPSAAGTRPPDDPDARELAVVVLAAGNGERMGGGTQKVLREMGGRALLGHVLDAVEEVRPRHTVVVTGRYREQVSAYLAKEFGDRAAAWRTAVQQEQRGYGHALLAGFEALKGFTGTVVVTAGDAPLLTAPTIRRLIADHEKSGNAMTLLSGRLPDTAGYSLVLRSEVGEYASLLPPDRGHRLEDDGRLREVGAGVYAFDAQILRAAFRHLLESGDTAGEYLATVVDWLTQRSHRIGITVAEDSRDVLGVNDQRQLSIARRALRDRINSWWMAAGVDIVDPDSTWIDVRVALERDVVVEANTRLYGGTTVHEGATVGPDTELRDCVVRAGAVVVRSSAVATTVGEGAVVGPYTSVEGSTVGAGSLVSCSVVREAEVGDQAEVGPYALVRPDTRLADRSKVGTFVEIKNSTLGVGAKVPHLSYVGDADIGDGSNIGGLSGFANYDGRKKYRTVVGRDVRIGGQNGLIAPVTVGDGAYSGARALISQDVPPGALVIAEGSIKQRNIPGWVQRNRPGSASALAAALAQGGIPEAPDDGEAAAQAGADATEREG